VLARIVAGLQRATGVVMEEAVSVDCRHLCHLCHCPRDLPRNAIAEIRTAKRVGLPGLLQVRSQSQRTGHHRAGEKYVRECMTKDRAKYSSFLEPPVLLAIFILLT
jgi:hypothetical protein